MANKSLRLRLLLISNMYPGKKNPDYGVFVRSIEQGLQINGVEVVRIVITGGSRNWVHKLLKYLMFYLQILTAPVKRFDVVQVGYPSHSYLPLMFRRLGNTLLAVRLHGLDLMGDPGEEGFLIRFGRLFTKLAIKRANLVVVPSQYFKNELEKRHKPAYVHVYPSGGINLGQFYPDEEKKLYYTIGYVGRLDRLKGVEVLLQALAKVNLPLKAIITGHEKLYKKLKCLSRHLGLTDRVNFTGWISHTQLKDIYNRMDVLVFPTMRKAESFGNVAIEAMACGTPVIGSRMSGLTEYLKEEINGFFFKPGDVEDLSHTIKHFFTLSDNSRMKLSSGALNTAKQFEQKKVSAGYVAKLLELLDR